MNAAQALITHVQRNGRNEQFLYKARQYLDRVRLDPANSKCQKLLGSTKDWPRARACPRNGHTNSRGK